MINRLFVRKIRPIAHRAEPRSEFVNRLRLQLEQAGYLPHRSSLRRWLFRHLAGFSSAMAMMVVGTTGVYAYVSDSVLPDHPLYPVREAMEKLEEHAPIPVARVKERLRANVAQRRVREIRTLLKRNRPLKPKQMDFLKNHPAARAMVAPLLDVTTTRLFMIASSTTGLTDTHALPLLQRRQERLERKETRMEKRQRQMQKRMERRQESKKVRRPIRERVRSFLPRRAD